MSPDFIDDHGFSSDNILGVLQPDCNDIDVSSFCQNKAFKLYIQSLPEIPSEPGLVEYINESDPDRVALIDRRTEDAMGDVPSEDIIGVYIVKNKKISRFEPNENYKLVTQTGTAKFTLGITKKLMETFKIK